MVELPRYLAGTGYHPLGLTSLREALADRFTERGLPTTPDQVMVTSGALAGLAVTARALLSPGDRVLLESPTYPNAIDTLRRSGARPVALPLDRDGWDVEAAEAALRQTAPRAAYLIPDFHNPTGALMPDAQRAALGDALAGTAHGRHRRRDARRPGPRPRRWSMPRPLGGPPPAHGHPGRREQVLLGRSAGRLDPRPARADAGPGRARG